MPQNRKKIHFDHNKEINKKAIKIHIGIVFSDHAKNQKLKRKKNAQTHTRDERLRREHLRRDDDEREKELMNMDQLEFQSASAIVFAYECREVTYLLKEKKTISRSALSIQDKHTCILIIASRFRLNDLQFHRKSNLIRSNLQMKATTTTTKIYIISF